jgi:hypothetical protein
MAHSGFGGGTEYIEKYVQWRVPRLIESTFAIYSRLPVIPAWEPVMCETGRVVESTFRGEVSLNFLVPFHLYNL